MANVAFSDLSALTTPADADLLCMTDDSEASGDKSKKITYSNFYTHLLSMSVCHRAQFTYKDADEIYIGAARYHHNGTTNQLVYWDSQLTYTFSNLAANDWCFLYLDDSAIVTAGTNLLTATEFVDSTTAPSWSATKHGWYSGSDRCIFAVYDDSIWEFVHDGNLVVYTTDTLDINESVSASWETFTLTIPDFCTRGLATLEYRRDGGNNSTLTYRTKGTSGTGLEVVRVYSSSYYSVNTLSLITDSSQRIELNDSTQTSGNTLRCLTGGWYFPVGM